MLCKMMNALFLYTHSLTHWGGDKMAAIYQTTIQMHFLEWKCINFDLVSIEGSN